MDVSVTYSAHHEGDPVICYLISVGLLSLMFRNWRRSCFCILLNGFGRYDNYSTSGSQFLAVDELRYKESGEDEGVRKLMNRSGKLASRKLNRIE